MRCSFGFLSSRPLTGNCGREGKGNRMGRGLGTQSPPSQAGVNRGEGTCGLVTKQLRFASNLMWLVAVTWGGSWRVWELEDWGRSKARHLVLGTGRTWEEGGSELPPKRIQRWFGGRQDPGAALSFAPLFPGGCLPCCQSNWRARLGSRILELASAQSAPADVSDIRALAANVEEALQSYRKRERGGAEVEERGSCGGPARALPHARAHRPSLCCKLPNPPPLRLRRKLALAAPTPHLESVFAN